MASFIRKIFRFRPVYLAIPIVLAGSFAYLVGIPFLDLMELKTIDLRFGSRGPAPTGSDVVLAVVDEKSIAKEGKWVWPRSKFVDLVNKLSAAGAKVIAFDIGFLEPDNMQLVNTIEEIEHTLQTLADQNPKIENYLKTVKRQSDNDQLLAEAVKRSSAKIVLGYFFHMQKADADYFDEKEMAVNEKNILASMYKLVRYTSREAQHVPLIEAYAPEANITPIAKAAKYAGTFSMNPDPDGVVRRMPAVFKFKENLYAPLSLMAVSAFRNEPIALEISDFGIESVRIGELSIPTDEYGHVFINYRGGPKTFPHIPVTDILKGKVPDSTFKDKIVLVGVTATGVYDLRVTPFAEVYPGIEIHANVMDTVLSKDFLNQPAWAAAFDLLAIIAAGLFLGLVLPRVGVVYGALAGAAIFLGYILLCYYFFAQKGWILNLVYPLSVSVLVYIGITAYRYLVEARQKRYIRSAFSTYLAPSVVKQLIDSPEKLVLGGEQRVITAFFSDVQGFTSISERLTPHELVELLNEFLTEMTDVILNYEGTVDKFEGDAIIAFFGAPNDLPNHPEVACKACIDMQKRLAELRQLWKTQQRPELKMRIGLCSGSAVVGNMGSKNRMDYTMMGDTVNTAARLEGVNKVYGIYTLISNTTFDTLDGNLATREIDSINVVGKNEPVTIYELLGYPDDIDKDRREVLEHYAKGLNAYRNQDWDGASGFFQSALAIAPEDGPSKTLQSRCQAYKVSPPGKNWDGSYTMETK